MKLSLLATLFYLTSLTIAAPPTSEPRDISIREPSPLDSYNSLEKRKGGGGGRGSGGSGGGGGGISGGRGTGTPRAYGGGNRYIGGATVPFRSGQRSPTRGISPYPFAIAGFAVFPAVWLFGSLYAYPYGYPYYWLENGRNRTSNVTCLCQKYSVCGCDPDGDEDVLRQMIGNGTDHPVNTSTIRTVDYGNGSVSSFINGTLDNDTTVDGLEGGAALNRAMGYSGYLVMAATVVAGVMMV